jgi:hypothetical protein
MSNTSPVSTPPFLLSSNCQPSSLLMVHWEHPAFVLAILLRLLCSVKGTYFWLWLRSTDCNLHPRMIFTKLPSSSWRMTQQRLIFRYYVSLQLQWRTIQNKPTIGAGHYKWKRSVKTSLAALLTQLIPPSPFVHLGSQHFSSKALSW